MFDALRLDEDAIASLGSDAALTAAARLRATSDRAEAKLLQVAAHFADLHPDPFDDSDTPECLRSQPGEEESKVYGGDGCPAVAEFAPAELGAVLGMTSHAAARLIGDALALRHRLPRTWARVLAGEVQAWRARQIANACWNLSQEAAALVDARVSDIAHSLTSYRLAKVVRAAVLEADPDLADQNIKDETDGRGVWVDPSDLNGSKAVFVKAAAGDVIRFDASIDLVANVLGELGDTDPKELRRAKAIGWLANPRATLNLWHTYQQTTPTPSPDPQSNPSHPSHTDAASQPDDLDQTDHLDQPDDLNQPDHLDPTDQPTQTDPVSQPHPLSQPDHVSQTDHGSRPEPMGRPEQMSRPGQEGQTGQLDRAVERVGKAGRVGRAESPDPVSQVGQGGQGGQVGVVVEGHGVSGRGLPGLGRYTLYVHLTDLTLASGEGLVRVGDSEVTERHAGRDGVGPMFAKQLAELIGHPELVEKITVKPVIDLADAVAVDSYEVPRRIRERVLLRHSRCVFPYCNRPAMPGTDLDHVTPYEHGSTGPPGQTSTENLAPLCRFHHRVKTHGRWKLRRLPDDAFEWTSPHGRVLRVDHSGTHFVRRGTGSSRQTQKQQDNPTIRTGGESHKPPATRWKARTEPETATGDAA
jgi:hypothetical protein